MTSHLTLTIEADPALSALWQLAQDQCVDDPAHDAAHLARVAEWTVRIVGHTVPQREAIAAAVLHDYVSIEKNSPDRRKAAEMSAEAARPLLQQQGFETAAIDRIASAIAAHSFSRGIVPADPLGRALQDADRLDALGSIGILRAVATGSRMGSQWMHPLDLWALDRPFDGRSYTIDHFFEKLLRLPGLMLTELGTAEARRRVGIMVVFLKQLGHEVGSPMPEDIASR